MRLFQSIPSHTSQPAPASHLVTPAESDELAGNRRLMDWRWGRSVSHRPSLRWSGAAKVVRGNTLRIKSNELRSPLRLRQASSWCGCLTGRFKGCRQHVCAPLLWAWGEVTQGVHAASKRRLLHHTGDKTGVSLKKIHHKNVHVCTGTCGLSGNLCPSSAFWLSGSSSVYFLQQSVPVDGSWSTKSNWKGLRLV